MKCFLMKSTWRTENKDEIFGQNLAEHMLLTTHQKDIWSNLYFKA